VAAVRKVEALCLTLVVMNSAWSVASIGMITAPEYLGIFSFMWWVANHGVRGGWVVRWGWAGLRGCWVSSKALVTEPDASALPPTR
jgi:hypothetical protein